MVINGIFISGAAQPDGTVYLTAINLDTPQNRALAAKLEKVSEQTYQESRQAEAGKPKPQVAEEAGSTRKRWTLEEKIECAQYAVKHGNQEAAAKFGVSPGMAATLKSHYNTGKLK